MNNGERTLEELAKIRAGVIREPTVQEMMEKAKRDAAKMNRLDDADAEAKFEKIYPWLSQLFGEKDPLFIPQGDRTKIPMIKWAKLTKLTRDDDYWKKFKIACARGGNLAIKLGKDSDGLVAVDIDRDDLIEEFLSANPELRKTFCTKASKGCQFWFYTKGSYPKEVRRICVKGNTKGTGEWRGWGLSTFWGIHPKGMEYTRVNEVKPIEYAWKDVKWPSGWSLVEPRQDTTIDWERFNECLSSGDGGVLDALVAEYFPGAVDHNDNEWRCADIAGNPPTNQGSFTIFKSNGWCYGLDGEWNDGFLNTITSRERGIATAAPVPTIKEIFEFIEKETGENFFIKKEKAEKLDVFKPYDPQMDYGIIYDVGSKQFYLPAPDGGFHSLAVEGLRRHLKIEFGLYGGEPRDDETANDVDKAIHRIETHNRVDLVGKFAGYPEAKIYPAGDLKMLVPKAVKRIEPVEGNWDFIKGFLGGLIPNPLELEVFRGWIKTSWLASQALPGDWTPGKGLILVGPGDTGKTATQKKIITPILGRDCDPTNYWAGRTNFNENMGEAEHWRLSDPEWSTRKEKEALANALKKAVSESAYPIHPKFQRERLLEIFKRVTMSLNDEDEPMSIFPLMPPSTLSKLIFLSTATTLTEFTPSAANWADWQKTVTEQLPAFLYDTLYKWEMPDEIRDGRYGVRYVNQTIHDKISTPSSDDKDSEIDQIIREAVFPDKFENLKKGSDGPSSRVKTGADIIALVHDHNFPLYPAAELSIPKSLVWVGKLLQRLSKNGGKRNGYTIEVVSEKRPVKYKFTKTLESA